MFATMEDYDGIGLAAPQVDRLIRLLVIGLPEEDSDDMPYLAVANPEDRRRSAELWDMEKGCLSIPDVRDDVTRPEAITVEYTTLNGKRKTIKATGMLAEGLTQDRPLERNSVHRSPLASTTRSAERQAQATRTRSAGVIKSCASFFAAILSLRFPLCAS